MTKTTNKYVKFLTHIILFIVFLSVLFFALKQGFNMYYKSAYPQKYVDLVEMYSEKNNLPIPLVYAVIRCESSFNPNAESNVPARGLMQITKETFEWAQFRNKETRTLSFDDLFDPEINIYYGTYILSLLLEEFEDIDTVIAAYHAGRGSVLKWLKDERYSVSGTIVDKETIPFPTTRTYVERVLKTQNIYEKLYNHNSQ